MLLTIIVLSSLIIPILTVNLRLNNKHVRSNPVPKISKNPGSLDPILQTLCDLIDSLDVRISYPEWMCDSSISSTDYCSWGGITCSDNEIIGLDLSGDFGGTLPPSIGNLAALTSLVLSETALSGSIPDSICSLRMLEILLLDNNHVSGSIPACIGTLFRLESLVLYSNQLEGTIPGIRSLDSLTELDLTDNLLTGPLPSFNQSFSLETIGLSLNYLTGPLPTYPLPSVGTFVVFDNLLSGTISSDFNGMIGLTAYNIQNNLITGTIPTAVQNAAFLNYFIAALNDLTGSIPSDLAQQYLYYVDMSSNALSGSVPTDFSTLPLLSFLYLENNQLIGGLPPLPAVLLLDVSRNKFTGSLPCGCASMVSLTLTGNHFNGSIPDCFTDMQYLQILDMSENSLTGTVPSLIELTGLLYYDLSHNKLHGTIPTAFDHAESLVLLALASNSLTGTISNSLGSSGQLVYLILQSNSLSGTIPSAAQHLRDFNCSFNKFTGPVIPPSWSANATIGVYYVANNSLTGSIPLLACSFPLLLSLFVGNNNLDLGSCYPGCLRLYYQDFYSVIPRCYGDQDQALCELTSSLEVAPKQAGVVVTTEVHIDSVYNTGSFFINQEFNYPNAFEYQISFFGYTVFALNDFVKLTWAGGELNLNDHNFTFPGYGQDPFKIQASSFNFMGYVDDTLKGGLYVTVTVFSRGSGWTCVNETRLVGGVTQHQLFADPCTWTGVTCASDQVTGLSLRGLALEGTIPSSLGLLSRLASLDLAFNSLRGHIPALSLPALSTLDLSSNSLTGTLPLSLSQSQQLSYLNVANNKLNGTVPSFLASMTYLSLIHLDANRFSGKLANDVCAVPTSGRSISVVNTDITCFESCWSEYSEQPSLFAHDDALAYCAPTSQPTSAPSSPSSMPTPAPKNDSFVFTTIEIILIVVAGLVFLFVLSLCVICCLLRRKVAPSPESLELNNMLRLCPIHKAVIDQLPLTPEFVSNNIETSTKLTPDGRTALDLILDAGSKCEANAVVVFLLLDNQLPKELKNVKTADGNCMNHNKAWCRMVQQHDSRSLAVVEKVLTAYRPCVSILAYGMDEYGRKFIHIASAKCKEAINRVLYLHERYEFDGPPEHQTSTSILRFAFDHKRIVDSHGVSVAKKVALKFMASASSFQREVFRRSVNNADSSDYFITVYESYDGDKQQDPEHKAFREDAISKGYEDYPYCIVMEAAESNLDRILNSRRIAGSNWEEIRRIFKQIVASVEYLHRHNVIHGDIKPSNVVVLSNTAVRIIDFDNSVAFGAAPTSDSSTAYCPPEHFEQGEGGVTVPKTITESHPSHDMWALGALLYLLCTGASLFFCDIDDNIADSDDMLALSLWDDNTRDRKLSKITDKLARNLVSLLLTKNVSMRIDALHAMEHPFLTGKQVIRLSGDKSEFDVFISYRVSSDAKHATLLYNELTARGLKVWLDSKSLKPGKNWEQGFCEGLFKSDYVVCLVSKEGMNHDTVESLNWSKLKETSYCDNVLLEWMLAIELHHRSLVKGVFPVFIGSSASDDAAADSNYDKFYLSGRELPDVSVAAVEEKLKHHLDREGCGLPYNLKYSVKAVVDEVASNQGAFLSGRLEDAVKGIIDKVEGMVKNRS